MRGVFSILIVAALFCSMFSPAWAGTCEAMKKQPTCHRQTKAVHHHCGMMENARKAGVRSDSIAAVGKNRPKCPMTCCNQVYSTTGIMFVPELISPERRVTGKELNFGAGVFSSAGFFSQTDRGPPLADSNSDSQSNKHHVS
jgi:hypothetical protein